MIYITGIYSFLRKKHSGYVMYHFERNTQCYT